jgi:hypothetical protein
VTLPKPATGLRLEQNRNKNEGRTRIQEVPMISRFCRTAAEIASLATFGAMVAIWALILAPGL